MTVERTQDEIIVRLSAAIDVEKLQKVLTYLTYREVTATSEATQEDADQLAAELTKERRATRKTGFIR